MPYPALYKQLANLYHEAFVENTASDTHLKNALDEIIDLSKTKSGQQATDIAVKLVTPAYKAWLGVVEAPIKIADQRGEFRTHAMNDIRKSVYAINYYVVKNESLFGTLTDFVNSITWDDGYVPYYWCLLSDDAGFDISLWNCSIS